jgi:hypothetical protein
MCKVFEEERTIQQGQPHYMGIIIVRRKSEDDLHM